MMHPIIESHTKDIGANPLTMVKASLLVKAPPINFGGLIHLGLSFQYLNLEGYLQSIALGEVASCSKSIQKHRVIKE